MSRRKQGRKTAAPAKSPDASEAPVAQITQTTESYSGPLPPSSELLKYDQIVAGAAERIIRMAEKSQDHQIKIENTAINAQKWEGRIGQIFALTISMAAFGTAVFAMIKDYPTVASIVAGTTIVSLAVAFIQGRKPS